MKLWTGMLNALAIEGAVAIVVLAMLRVAGIF